jgi:hypothetical protein
MRYIKFHIHTKQRVKLVESEEFWWSCITLRRTGFLDFVHRPEWKMDVSLCFLVFRTQDDGQLSETQYFCGKITKFL